LFLNEKYGITKDESEKVITPKITQLKFNLGLEETSFLTLYRKEISFDFNNI